MHDLKHLQGRYMLGYHRILVKEDLVGTSCFQITMEKMYLKCMPNNPLINRRKEINIPLFIYTYYFSHFHFGIFYNVGWCKYN